MQWNASVGFMKSQARISHFGVWEWKLGHCAVVEKSIARSSGKEEENGNWDKVCFCTDLQGRSVWVTGEADGQRDKWGWAALKCQMYLERSWMALSGIWTALLKGILWRKENREWKGLWVAVCLQLHCFILLICFHLPYCMEVGTWSIFRRIDQNLELRMQLD